MKLLLLLTALGSQLSLTQANGPVVGYNEHLSTLDDEVICASEVRAFLIGNKQIRNGEKVEAAARLIEFCPIFVRNHAQSTPYLTQNQC